MHSRTPSLWRLLCVIAGLLAFLYVGPRSTQEALLLGIAALLVRLVAYGKEKSSFLPVLGSYGSGLLVGWVSALLAFASWQGPCLWLVLGMGLLTAYRAARGAEQE